MPVTLNDISLLDPELDAELKRWRVAIERANAWAVGGGCEFDEGDFGFALFVGGRKSGGRHAVVMEPGIEPAPDDDTLGTGPIMLRKRDGADLEDDKQGVLWINFTTFIPPGTRITVVPDGKDWTIPGANCPPDDPAPAPPAP